VALAAGSDRFGKELGPRFLGYYGVVDWRLGVRWGVL